MSAWNFQEKHKDTRKANSNQLSGDLAWGVASCDTQLLLLFPTSHPSWNPEGGPGWVRANNLRLYPDKTELGREIACSQAWWAAGPEWGYFVPEEPSAFSWTLMLTGKAKKIVVAFYQLGLSHQQERLALASHVQTGLLQCTVPGAAF